MEILNINSACPALNDSRLIKKMGDWLKQGQVLVCPTDTVYGLIADASNLRAVKRVFKIKKRNLTRPLPFFVSGLDQAEKVAEISKQQEGLLKKVWPGKFTVVLKRKPGSEKMIAVAEETIALRLPDHPLINGILKQTGLVLTATSANISGQPPCCRIGEVRKQFEDQEEQPDIVVDAGDLPVSKPSTIIDFSALNPRILRRGDQPVKF